MKWDVKSRLPYEGFAFRPTRGIRLSSWVPPLISLRKFINYYEVFAKAWKIWNWRTRNIPLIQINNKIEYRKKHQSQNWNSQIEYTWLLLHRWKEELMHIKYEAKLQVYFQDKLRAILDSPIDGLHWRKKTIA